jgi:hypothetical protein
MKGWIYFARFGDDGPIKGRGCAVVTRAASSAAPMIAEPVAGDFEYMVRLGVAIPLAWARVLKTTGAHHYDHKCREMSECGVVNGLHNVATFNEDPAFEGFSFLPVTWSDCDGMMKILEQAHYKFDPAVIVDIRAWLRRTMDRIEARHREIASVPVAGGEGV